MPLEYIIFLINSQYQPPVKTKMRKWIIHTYTCLILEKEFQFYSSNLEWNLNLKSVYQFTFSIFFNSSNSDRIFFFFWCYALINHNSDIAKWKSLQICSDFNKETVSSGLLLGSENHAGIRKKKNRFSLNLIRVLSLTN